MIVIIDIIFRLEGCVNRHELIKTFDQKEQKSNQKPWVTNEILKKIKRRKLFAQRKGNPNDVNIKRIYVLFRNAILKLQRNHTLSGQRFWNSLNSLNSSGIFLVLEMYLRLVLELFMNSKFFDKRLLRLQHFWLPPVWISHL